ncbi:hypothetical protein UFOVP1419_48 [uncultured Caudovirales phage]|uniref:Uncharacterized protein n=1 Tax=uncultured Caudovirales phage TaxID=2100421 RepID=A0A6J5SEA2_9CAUD|nr:hypothetical protein UFOVP1419_48 [uncultured Caudovirales phage]
MRKLDRTQPFGEIYGSDTARYEQHGIQFDGQGKEIPGFEAVVVPDTAAVVASSDYNGLLREIGRLTDEMRRLQAECDDKDALYEEAVGQLDTARVEINRLNALSLDSVPVDGGAATTDIDLQLDLQSGGNAGKKGK